MIRSFFLSLALSSLLALAFPAMVQAEDTVVHAKGHLRTPPAELATFPTPPVYRDFVPVAVDLSGYFPRVGDQGAMGSCVSWAVGFAARAYYARMVEGRDNADLSNVPSPAFIYNATHEKSTDDNPCSNGSYTPNVFKLLQHGAMSLADFPYDGKSCPPISPKQKLAATDFKIAGFSLVGTWDPKTGAAGPDTVDAVKAELAQGHPVIIGVDLNDDFENMHGPAGLSVWNAGAIDPSAPWSGHEITLVGYDDTQQSFKFINSWGPEWGDNGFGRMTYDTFRQRADEAFVIEMPGDPEIPLQEADFRPDVIGPGPMLRTDANVGAAAPGATVAVGGLWCGHVDVGGPPGARKAGGFVSSDSALADLKQQLGDSVDASGVQIAPWPLCETRLTLADALAAEGAPDADVSAGANGGHTITLAPPSGHLYVLSYGADGSEQVADASGGGTVDIAGGIDTALLISSTQPLFVSVPNGVPARQFLNQLRAAVMNGQGGELTARLIALP